MPTPDPVMAKSAAAEHEWLSESVRLATENVESGGGPFGAVIVRDGEIIATGTNLVTTSTDPTAHAEVVAIRRACASLGDFQLAGCVLVSSCEPCPLCLSAALWARVHRVVYCADRDDAAAVGFDDREFYELFSQPKSNWPTEVEQVSIVQKNDPFTAWQEKPDKVAY